jgi:hypothetical protein
MGSFISSYRAESNIPNTIRAETCPRPGCGRYILLAGHSPNGKSAPDQVGAATCARSLRRAKILSYTLNQGVIHTYLMWKRRRRSILMGSASMVIRKTIMMEYCSKLLRW